MAKVQPQQKVWPNLAHKELEIYAQNLVGSDQMEHDISSHIWCQTVFASLSMVSLDKSN